MTRFHVIKLLNRHILSPSINTRMKSRRLCGLCRGDDFNAEQKSMPLYHCNMGTFISWTAVIRQRVKEFLTDMPSANQAVDDFNRDGEENNEEEDRNSDTNTSRLDIIMSKRLALASQYLFFIFYFQFSRTILLLFLMYLSEVHFMLILLSGHSTLRRMHVIFLAVLKICHFLQYL